MGRWLVEMVPSFLDLNHLSVKSRIPFPCTLLSSSFCTVLKTTFRGQGGYEGGANTPSLALPTFPRQEKASTILKARSKPGSRK